MDNFTHFKKIITLIYFSVLFFPTKSFCQTWVTTSFWDSNYGIYVNHDSSGIGPYQMCMTPNGKIYMLVEQNMDEQINLMSFSPAGNILLNSPVSHSGGIFSESTGSLHACQDNSIVYNVIHSNAPNDYSKTFKTSPNSWTITSHFPDVVTAVVPTSYNTTLLYFGGRDSLIEVDSLSNFIRSRQLIYSNTKFECVQDSDLIIYDTYSLTKQDFNGTIKWTINDTFLFPISNDTSNIFCFKSDSVLKIRAKTGSLVWKKYIPHTFYNGYLLYKSIAITSDSGLIVTDMNNITRYDSSGNIVWTKTNNFPSFGYKAIIQDTAGYYFTGGAYICLNAGYIPSSRGFGYFAARLDSNGNGTIDSTDHYFTGNANDNYIFSFADDAAFIGASLGNSGTPLPSAIQANNFNSISAFGPDWAGGFVSGINYKFCDADGNGLIDTNDLHTINYSNTTNTYSNPHWRVSAPAINSVNNLNVSFAEDTLMPGDSATIYVYIDSTATIDSIYSISIEMYSNLFSQNGITAIDQAGNFGTPGVNLFTYCSNCSYVYNGIRYLMSKTDHLNSSLHGDTLMKFRCALDGMASGYCGVFMNFHAITKGGYDVSLNLVNDSVYFFNPNASVNDLQRLSFSIMPNPGSGIFYLSSSAPIDQVVVMNLEGRIILEKEQPGSSIELSSQPDGIYFVQIWFGREIVRKKLAVMR